MVITGDIRGFGKQLSNYLVTIGENEDIEILDVDGRECADETYLHQVVMSMEYNAELTKSNKPYLHVQISPAIGEDIAMTHNQWNEAADLLAKEIGYENQRRVIVLHTKNDRIHAHVVYERYNHATGKIIDNKFSKLKMNFARQKLEKALGHEITPTWNSQKNNLKEIAGKLWSNTTSGREFILAAKKEGLIVAQGVPKRPFRLIDQNGRSFDLVRQLDGVRTKDVRARLRNETLIPEKEAIKIIREQQQNSSGKRDKQSLKLTPIATVKSFAENRDQIVSESITEQDLFAQKFNAFTQEGHEINEPKPTIEQDKKQKAAVFAENRNLTEALDKDVKRQKLITEQKALEETMRRRQKPKL